MLISYRATQLYISEMYIWVDQYDINILFFDVTFSEHYVIVSMLIIIIHLFVAKGASPSSLNTLPPSMPF
jgi:hypothetical protein